MFPSRSSISNLGVYERAEMVSTVEISTVENSNYAHGRGEHANASRLSSDKRLMELKGSQLATDH